MKNRYLLLALCLLLLLPLTAANHVHHPPQNTTCLDPQQVQQINTVANQTNTSNTTLIALFTSFCETDQELNQTTQALEADVATLHNNVTDANTRAQDVNASMHTFIDALDRDWDALNQSDDVAAARKDIMAEVDQRITRLDDQADTRYNRLSDRYIDNETYQQEQKQFENRITGQVYEVEQNLNERTQVLGMPAAWVLLMGVVMTIFIFAMYTGVIGTDQVREALPFLEDPESETATIEELVVDSNIKDRVKRIRLLKFLLAGNTHPDTDEKLENIDDLDKDEKMALARFIEEGYIQDEEDLQHDVNISVNMGVESLGYGLDGEPEDGKK